MTLYFHHTMRLGKITPFHSLSEERLVDNLFRTVVLRSTSNSHLKRFSLQMNDMFLEEVANCNDLLTAAV